MPVKNSRKISTPRTTSSKNRQNRTYSERWDLSHLAEKPVQHFETLLGEIEAKVAQFESARTQLSPTMEASAFRSLLTLSEEIAAAASKIGAYAYLWPRRIVTLWPWATSLLRFGPLHSNDLAVSIGAGITLLVVLEIAKSGWRRLPRA